MFPRSITKTTQKPHKTALLGVSAAIPAPPPPPPDTHSKPLTLRNKASALALFALVFTLIPAHHASAQVDLMPTFGSLTIPDLTFTQDKPITPLTFPEATGGDPPLIYDMSGAARRPGLTFDRPTRVLSGTPTFSDTATRIGYAVGDNDRDIETLRFDIITEPDTIPTFGASTISAQNYLTTAAVNVTLPTATGGNRALTYTLTPALPANLIFDGTATPPTITGTPATITAQADYTYTVTDDDGSTAALTFPLTASPLSFGATIPRQMYAPDEPVSVTLPTATGGEGTLTYAITEALPDGLSFTPATRVLAGTPTIEQDEMTYTYTVTDSATTPNTAQQTFTIAIGQFGSERVVEKTLAAFGRAFATGTVGVFEDYLTNTGATANTSHFTIGGHKFELATTTPAQTLDSRVASVRKPLTRQRTLTLENDDSVINTPSASYPQKYKSPSVSFPNDRKTGSDSDHVFHRIGNPVEHDPPNLAGTINSANLADTTSNGATTGTANTPATTTLMSARDLLMKSAFHFNLNDDATATSTWSLWARATTSDFDGKPEDDFEQDGDVTSAYLGADYRTPNGTRLGLAISETSGEIDYDDQADDIQGDLDADLTSILPYIQWQPNDATNAWVVLGYGEGEAELATDGDAETTDVDIEMQMIAAGVSGDLTTYKRSEWSWKASAFAVELESDKNEETDLPAVTADSQRLRVAMQSRVPGTPSSNGAQLTPNWELGLRWDDGDAEQGSGADLGLGFDYRHPASGLSMQGKANALLVHEENDYEEWNASLQVRYDPGARGRGVTFTLEPGWSKNGRSQKMGMDFSNALGKWTKRGLRLELTGERTEKTDDNIGHNIRLTGSLRF